MNIPEQKRPAAQISVRYTGCHFEQIVQTKDSPQWNLARRRSAYYPPENPVPADDLSKSGVRTAVTQGLSRVAKFYIKRGIQPRNYHVRLRANRPHAPRCAVCHLTHPQPS